MVDISLLGSSVSQPQASSAVIRPPGRIESERLEVRDSEIERGEVERAESAAASKANQQAFIQAKEDIRSDTIEATGSQVDVVV